MELNVHCALSSFVHACSNNSTRNYYLILITIIRLIIQQMCTINGMRYGKSIKYTFNITLTATIIMNDIQQMCTKKVC
mgnify:CR=1 FL=1